MKRFAFALSIMTCAGIAFATQAQYLKLRELVRQSAADDSERFFDALDNALGVLPQQQRDAVYTRLLSNLKLDALADAENPEQLDRVRKALEAEYGNADELLELLKAQGETRKREAAPSPGGRGGAPR